MSRHPRGCRAVDPGRQRRALERWRVAGPVLLCGSVPKIFKQAGYQRILLKDDEQS